jgi:hypothetical protein
MSKTCNNCGEAKTPSTVPYQVLKDFKDTSTATIKRLWILIVILVLMLVGTNVAWLIYESQYEVVEYSYDYQQDGQGTNIIGNGNDVNNGTETQSEG